MNGLRPPNTAWHLRDVAIMVRWVRQDERRALATRWVDEFTEARQDAERGWVLAAERLINAMNAEDADARSWPTGARS